jgi:PelA/Pel-15E family pectate lyase
VPEPGNVTWARFYELDSNEPFFCGRDGVKKKKLEEVEFERRVGYAWYNESPAKLLSEDYPKWKAKWIK